MIAVKCLVCGEINVSKNEKTSKGTQKYICNNKECARMSCLQDYSYNGRKPRIDEQIIAMAANASGIRDTSRVLNVSKQKVTDTLKKQQKQ